MSCIDAPIHGPEGQIIPRSTVLGPAPTNRGFNRLIGRHGRNSPGDRSGFLSLSYRDAGSWSPEAEDERVGAAGRDGTTIGGRATRVRVRAFGLAATAGDRARPGRDLLWPREGARRVQRAPTRRSTRALARSGGNVSAARGPGIRPGDGLSAGSPR